MDEGYIKLIEFIVIVGLGYFGGQFARKKQFEEVLKAQYHIPDGHWVDSKASRNNFEKSHVWNWDFEKMIVRRKN